MSLAAEIKKSMFAAMKAKNVVEKEILRVAMGEITRSGDDPSDEEVQALLRKLIKSNREALESASDEEQKTTLNAEIASLQKFLPQALSVEQIVEALSGVSDAIKAAPNQGPAMGLAMKTLKSSGAEADSGDVAKAVAKIRS